HLGEALHPRPQITNCQGARASTQVGREGCAHQKSPPDGRVSVLGNAWSGRESRLRACYEAPLSMTTHTEFSFSSCCSPDVLRLNHSASLVFGPAASAARRRSHWLGDYVNRTGARGNAATKRV